MGTPYCSYAGLFLNTTEGVAQSVRPRAPVAFALQTHAVARGGLEQLEEAPELQQSSRAIMHIIPASRTAATTQQSRHWSRGALALQPDHHHRRARDAPALDTT